MRIALLYRFQDAEQLAGTSAVLGDDLVDERLLGAIERELGSSHVPGAPFWAETSTFLEPPARSRLVDSGGELPRAPTVPVNLQDFMERCGNSVPCITSRGDR